MDEYMHEQETRKQKSGESRQRCGQRPGRSVNDGESRLLQELARQE